MKLTPTKRSEQLAIAYQEGADAYNSGAPVDTCNRLYKKNSVTAKHWRTGWYDARTRQRLKHIWDRWNIEYP